MLRYTEENRPAVPFLTPTNYWTMLLGGKPENINRFHALFSAKVEWHGIHDSDLHVYPYIHAVPSALSMGCKNKCPFCPTAAMHKGTIHYGDPSVIIPFYKGQSVHFMDEDFFHNDLSVVLPLLKAYGVNWLGMGSYGSVRAAFDEFGEVQLWESGCRCIEIGLENVALYMKVGDRDLRSEKIELYYLNMTFLPGETIETMQQTAEWMKSRSLRHPIHYNNGIWFAPGQFYYPYDKEVVDGGLCLTKNARTTPTYVPDTFLNQTVRIISLEGANYFNRLCYDLKYYPLEKDFSVRDFLSIPNTEWIDPKKAMWLAVGIRSGQIKGA